MATYSSNTTVKVSGALSFSGSGNGTSTYTVPANSYLILNYMEVQGNAGGGAASAAIQINGKNILSRSASGLPKVVLKPALDLNNDANSTTEGYGAIPGGVYLGPGETLSAVRSGSSSTYEAHGVLFVNTP